MSRAEDTFILLNPKAGNGRVAHQWSHWKEPILEAVGTADVQIELTSAEDPGTQKVREALKAGKKNLIVIGGDGTLSAAVQGFFENGKPVNPEATLSLLPGGRGDDFFKTLTGQRFIRHDTAWNEGLRVLKEGSPHPLDVGRISWDATPHPSQKSYFMNVVSMGFPAWVVSEVHSGLNHGLMKKTSFIYVFKWWSLIGKYQRHPDVQIRVDDRIFFDGPIHTGFIQNGRFNAGGVCWDPSTRPDDGLLNLWILESCGPGRVIQKTLQSAVLGQISGQNVRRTTGRKIEVIMKAPACLEFPFFEIDGETVQNSNLKRAVFEALPNAIRFQRLG